MVLIYIINKCTSLYESKHLCFEILMIMNHCGCLSKRNLIKLFQHSLALKSNHPDGSSKKN